jgi:hypothetical protein
MCAPYAGSSTVKAQTWTETCISDTTRSEGVANLLHFSGKAIFAPNEIADILDTLFKKSDEPVQPAQRRATCSGMR